MPQLANVVLKDNAATDHTFIPRDITGGVATLVESTGVPVGDKQVSISRTRTATGRQKITMKIAIPVVQDVVVAGVTKPTSVRTAYADVVLTFDSTSNTAERDDLLAYAKSLLANTDLVKAMVENLSSPF